ncbi:class I SAM-dependent methyltransferase [Streptomyces sp. NPDC059651]|uniref:class I SAM-dependent methyltransferase n=1 Tax=unclassified Streptomyces TaxID=2593676 RepID=UPI000A4A582A
MGTAGTQESYNGASPDAIQHHYDVSNEFYRVWLDENRIYSCALWEDGDTLESAQLRKLDYFVAQTDAAGSGRVLDIGCGWGGLLQRMSDVHGVESTVGLTLSEEQADAARALGLPGAEVRLENWMDHRPTEKYDAIISIGAFEHFARRGLSRAERVAGYRAFFESCRSWLRPGGRLGLQTVGKGNVVKLDRAYIRDIAFVSDDIFPETEPPRLSEILEASELIFDPIAVRFDGAHYGRTIRTWLERLQKNRAAAEAVAGPETVLKYERYLEVTAQSFEKRFANLFRITFE